MDTRCWPSWPQWRWLGTPPAKSPLAHHWNFSCNPLAPGQYLASRWFRCSWFCVPWGWGNLGTLWVGRFGCSVWVWSALPLEMVRGCPHWPRWPWRCPCWDFDHVFGPSVHVPEHSVKPVPSDSGCSKWLWPVWCWPRDSFWRRGDGGRMVGHGLRGSQPSC